MKCSMLVHLPNAYVMQCKQICNRYAAVLSPLMKICNSSPTFGINKAKKFELIHKTKHTN